jgi:hypothetical protein
MICSFIEQLTSCSIEIIIGVKMYENLFIQKVCWKYRRREESSYGYLYPCRCPKCKGVINEHTIS